MLQQPKDALNKAYRRQKVDERDSTFSSEPSLVYELYGLTEEEIAIVEGNIK